MTTFDRQPHAIRPTDGVYRHQVSPIPSLIIGLWHAALANAALGDDLFQCSRCWNYLPDAFAAGRTGRDWLCENCAHGKHDPEEVGLPL